MWDLAIQVGGYALAGILLLRLLWTRRDREQLQLFREHKWRGTIFVLKDASGKVMVGRELNNNWHAFVAAGLHLPHAIAGFLPTVAVINYQTNEYVPLVCKPNVSSGIDYFFATGEMTVPPKGLDVMCIISYEERTIRGTILPRTSTSGCYELELPLPDDLRVSS